MTVAELETIIEDLHTGYPTMAEVAFKVSFADRRELCGGFPIPEEALNDKDSVITFRKGLMTVKLLIKEEEAPV